MSDEQLSILDRESRLFACWQAVVDLMNPSEVTRSNASTQELLDFITEEYNKAREEMRRTVSVRGA